MAKVKVTLSLEEAVIDYLKSEADRIGVSLSGLVSVMADSYKRSIEMPELVRTLNDILSSPAADLPVPDEILKAEEKSKLLP